MVRGVAGDGWPLQFSAAVVREAGRIDPAREYPLSRDHLRVHYDAVAGRARLDFEGTGEVRVKRFDAGWEARYFPGGECAWGPLEGVAMSMPLPEWPESAEFVKAVYLTEKKLECDKWRDERREREVVWIYNSRGFHPQPVQVRVESKGVPGTSSCSPEPDMTYSMLDFRSGEPEEAVFELPPGLDVARCSSLPRGLPLEHFWHSYLRV